MKKIIPALLLFSPLYASVETTVQMDKTFNNSDCEKTQSCDLKSFRIRVQDSKVNFEDQTPSFLTSSFMSYETKDIASLEKFGVVQFIKGCQFTSTDAGQIYLNISRQYFNGTVVFKHPNMVIDSDDHDPLYNSNTENDNFSRHALYRWNDVPQSFDKATEHFLYESIPTSPRLYVLDRPGTAFYDDDAKDAKNISLQFKSCIYKIEEIPSSTTPEGLSPDTAIKCFDWYSAYVYDHQKKKFNRKNEIAPPCL